MPSSLTTGPVTVSVPRESPLLSLLAGFPDPRDPRGLRHALAGVLATGIAAVLADAWSFTAIGEWAAESAEEVLTSLGMTRGAEDEATFRRLFAKVDADILDRLLGAFMWARNGVVDRRRVIAIDGKTIHGARRRGHDSSTGAAPHLVAARDHAAETMLGQIAVDAKSNEIPSARDLLGCFDSPGRPARWTRCTHRPAPSR